MRMVYYCEIIISGCQNECWIANFLLVRLSIFPYLLHSGFGRSIHDDHQIVDREQM